MQKSIINSTALSPGPLDRSDRYQVPDSDKREMHLLSFITIIFTRPKITLKANYWESWELLVAP